MANDKIITVTFFIYTTKYVVKIKLQKLGRKSLTEVHT